jgi:uncharacterized protein
MKLYLILSILILSIYSTVLGGEFEDTLKLAEQGNAIDQFNVGTMYDYGQGVTKNYKKAIFWYTKAAQQGFFKAQHNLGVMYENGKGVPQDFKKAIYWYTKAAENGDASAQHNLGLIWENGKGAPQDYKKAIYWYEKAAKQGVLTSQFNAGVMYENGQGVQQDYKKAIYWYTKAAEQMYANAQYNLGSMYIFGRGVVQNFKQGAYWWTKAAENGVGLAQLNLGILYYRGEGVTQNYKLAYVWNSLAAAQGLKDASENRDMIAEKLSPHQLSEAQELAAKIQYKIDRPSNSEIQQSSEKKHEQKIIGSGTGFFITRDGYLLTCHHVIKNAVKIKIAFGGNILPANLVRVDPNNDIALLKINGSFPAIAFSSKRSAKLGEEVFTIGFPNPNLQGMSAKFTKGTISSLTGFQDDVRLYQVSIPVQPGNSGGALIDKNGNILGIIVAMLSAKTTFKISGSLPQNVNYAIKALYAQAMMETLPEVSSNLILESKNDNSSIERTKNATVMIFSYE